MFEPLKYAVFDKLVDADKHNFAFKDLYFNLFLQPHQFKRGKQHCATFVKQRLGKFNRRVDGFIIYYGTIKVFPQTITKGIQGGVHLRAKVDVGVFLASSTNPFESKIVRIEDNFAIGKICGIETRYDLKGTRSTISVGQKVKSIKLKYSERGGISTLTCAQVK
uniref:Ribosomal protein S1 n=1 Tax=Panagrolaimus sp. ES5 TaxID=591445 RepID=A0AC34F730_9BILA